MRRIQAEVKRQAAVLRFHYVIEGELDLLRLAPRGAQPLWQHTCCEAFVARRGAAAYHEFNFAPSGDWAAYAFTAYRQGASSEIADPEIVVHRSSGMLELQASVAMQEAPLLLGLSAVIEERDGALSYWALRHAPGKPDFHHRDAFALELA